MHRIKKLNKNLKNFLREKTFVRKKGMINESLHLFNIASLMFMKKVVAFRKKDLSKRTIEKLRSLGWQETGEKLGIIFRPPKENPRVYYHENIIKRELLDKDVIKLFLNGFDAFPEDIVNQYTVARLVSEGWKIREIGKERFVVAPEELWKIKKETPKKQKKFVLDEQTKRFLRSVEKRLREIVKQKENGLITLEECENKLKEIIERVLPTIGLNPKQKVFPVRLLSKDQQTALKILGFAYKGKPGWGKKQEPRFVNLWYGFD